MNLEDIYPHVEEIVRRLLDQAEPLGIGGVQLASVVVDDSGHPRQVMAILIGDRPEDTASAVERMCRDIELRSAMLALIDSPPPGPGLTTDAAREPL